jgi:hypothetical protein
MSPQRSSKGLSTSCYELRMNGGDKLELCKFCLRLKQPAEPTPCSMEKALYKEEKEWWEEEGK